MAHRLSTIVRAEQIVVMDQVSGKSSQIVLIIKNLFFYLHSITIKCSFQGKVIEVGNHRDLVEKGGRYAELWEHQQQEEKGEIENERL